MLTCSQQPLGGCRNWNLNCHDFRPVCSVPFEALILPTVSDVWDLFSPIKALCSLKKSELDNPSKWEEKWPRADIPLLFLGNLASIGRFSKHGS